MRAAEFETCTRRILPARRISGWIYFDDVALTMRGEEVP